VQFVADASDSEFAREIGNYLDVEEFLRFLAAEVVIVNTDSPLGMNHNYWITVQPKTHKVVWLPWDMNMAFGGFRGGDIDLSLRSPSPEGMFPLADRLLAAPQWLRRYNEILRDMMTSNVTVARMSAEITGMAAVIREAVAADQTTTLAAFERSVVEQPSNDTDANGSAGGFFGPGRGGPPLRQFVEERIESVVEQLDGKRVGTPGRGRRFGPPPSGRF
jgi:spore coat protein H